MHYVLNWLLALCMAAAPALLMAQQQVAAVRQPVATDVAASQALRTDAAGQVLPGQALPLNSLAGLGADYRIGPNDLIDVEVYGVADLKRTVRVNSSGMVSLALVGNMALAGLTAQQAEAAIAAKYAEKYLQDPQVSVFIKEYTSQRITMEGAVAKPGIYPIRGQTTLMQAIAIAGGQGQLPELSDVKVYRFEGGEKKIYTFDLTKIRAGEMEDPTIVNDDVIVVNRAASRVVLRDSIVGDVINIFNPFNYLPRY